MNGIYVQSWPSPLLCITNFSIHENQGHRSDTYLCNDINYLYCGAIEVNDYENYSNCYPSYVNLNVRFISLRLQIYLLYIYLFFEYQSLNKQKIHHSLRAQNFIQCLDVHADKHAISFTQSVNSYNTTMLIVYRWRKSRPGNDYRLITTVAFTLLLYVWTGSRATHESRESPIIVFLQSTLSLYNYHPTAMLHVTI